LSDDEEDSNQDETLSLLIKKFNRFLKKKNRKKFKPRKRYVSKHNESGSANYTCFCYSKPRHIKVDCSRNQNKKKSLSRKADKGKGKKAYHGKTMACPHPMIPL